MIAALVTVPTGVADAGIVLLDPSLLPLGLGVAIFSSALPYTLEMIALRRLSTRVFGTLMSFEPAIAALAGWLPAAVGTALAVELGLPDGALAQLSRDGRRRLSRSLIEWPLAVEDTRGYTYAEVTAGGVALGELDPTTMESRICPGLFLVGEVLDVDGRIGGYNFQWAWASARAAARGLTSTFTP